MSDADHLAQRQALKDLNTMARADLESVWPVLTQGSATELRDGLADVLPALGNGYGNAAAQLGATYYEDLRDLSGAKKPFDPVLPDLPDEGRWGALANWSTVELRDQEKAIWQARLEDQFLGKANPALGKDPGEDARWAVAMEKVYGGLQRSIADQHRLTVVQSSLADPAAQGWARVGVGGSCEFCTMLIGRGEVYSDATVTFRAHDHCNCSAAPAFSNLLAPPKIFDTGLSDSGINPLAKVEPTLWDEAAAQATVDDIMSGYVESRSAFSSTLSKADRDSLRFYRGAGYSYMNKVLRGQPIDLPASTSFSPAREADTMSQLFKRPNAPRFKEQGRVWRGVGQQQDFDPRTVYRPGEYVVEPGFTSTTASLDEARHFAESDGEAISGWVMEVRVPKDTRFMYGVEKEAEIVLDKNTAFKVLERDDEARQIVLEVVEG